MPIDTYFKDDDVRARFDAARAAVRHARAIAKRAEAPKDTPAARRALSTATRTEATGRLLAFAGMEQAAEFGPGVDLGEIGAVFAELGPRTVPELLDVLQDWVGKEESGNSGLGLDPDDWKHARAALADVDVVLRTEKQRVVLDMKAVGALDGTYALVNVGPTAVAPTPRDVFGRPALADALGALWRAPAIDESELNVPDYFVAAQQLLVRQLYAERREFELVPVAQVRGSEPVSGIVFLFAALAVFFGAVSLGFGATSPAPGSPAFWVAVISGALAVIFGIIACATAGPACVVVVSVPASKCGPLCN